ncbi:MAG: CHAT domain-containing protein, partial [Acidobacteriota bacterium]|nr:CHAT domain-containing protein [Acidobacteriota bacterium]
LARRRQSTTALLIGGPTLDPSTYPALSDLPHARKEATAIALLYGRGADLRVGDDARRDVLLREAPGRTIIHIASHALPNLLRPDLATIPLSPSATDGNGTLYAWEVAAIPFERTRLVVLAGCGTGTGRVTAGEGMLSLARAFLQAGVPSVAATLWDIDDSTASPLFYRFHRELLAGRSPVAALRAAQLSLLEGPDPNLQLPSVWSSVEVFNGTSPIAFP